MITIKPSDADLQNLYHEFEIKVEGIAELKNPEVLREFADAIYRISVPMFIKEFNKAAKAEPKAYHHLYEWGMVGDNKSRLFEIEKIASTGNKLIIGYRFTDSKKPVPIASELLRPGRTGKFVRNRSVFRKKAEVMENGKPIVYRTKRNIPIPSNGKITWVAYDSLIRNTNPGGRLTKNSFRVAFDYWFTNELSRVISSSKIVRSVADETAKVLSKQRGGPKEVHYSVIQTLRQFKGGSLT